jgi:hypothetical protein
MECREAVLCKPCGLDPVGRWTDDDLLERASPPKLPPVKFPAAHQRRAASPGLHIGRGLVAQEKLLEAVLLFIPVCLMLEEHDAPDDVHRMIDKKVHHIGVQRIATHARRPRQAYQRIDQIDERGLNPRQFRVVIGDMEGRMLLDRLALTS